MYVKVISLFLFFVGFLGVVSRRIVIGRFILFGHVSTLTDAFSSSTSAGPFGLKRNKILF